MNARALSIIGGLVLLVAGVIWLDQRQQEQSRVQQAVAAERVRASQQTADSLRRVLAQRDAEKRSDSIRADSAERVARASKVATARARAERDSIKAALAVLSDTSVILPGDSVPTPIPHAVGALLIADQTLITKQGQELIDKEASYQLKVKELADEKAARATADDRAAALERVNAHLKTEIAGLAPPKCGRTCGIVIGVAATAAVVWAVKQ
jgi:hypothetical protein